MRARQFAAGDPRRDQVQLTPREKSAPRFTWRRTELDLPWREPGPRSSRLRSSPRKLRQSAELARASVVTAALLGRRAEAVAEVLPQANE